MYYVHIMVGGGGGGRGGGGGSRFKEQRAMCQLARCLYMWCFSLKDSFYKKTCTCFRV